MLDFYNYSPKQQTLSNGTDMIVKLLPYELENRVYFSEIYISEWIAVAKYTFYFSYHIFYERAITVPIFDLFVIMCTNYSYLIYNNLLYLKMLLQVLWIYWISRRFFKTYFLIYEASIYSIKSASAIN
jgi:hypothetical protein